MCSQQTLNKTGNQREQRVKCMYGCLIRCTVIVNRNLRKSSSAAVNCACSRCAKVKLKWLSISCCAEAHAIIHDFRCCEMNYCCITKTKRAVDVMVTSSQHYCDEVTMSCDVVNFADCFRG